MKIIFFTDNFYPELSGVADSIITIVKELSKKHNIYIYAPKYSKQNYKIANKKNDNEIYINKNVIIKRCTSIPYPSQNKQARFVIPTLLRWREIKKINPDIIHTHLFGGCGIEAIYTAKKLNIPLVGTNHTHMMAFIDYSIVDYKKTMLYINWFYDKCDIITVPSKHIADEMIKYGFKKNIQIIPNPIDTNIFKPLTKDEKYKLKSELNINGFIIFYCGRIVKEKNIDIIIYAINELKYYIPNIKLLIAGHGEEIKKLKKITEIFNLQNKVIFLGTIEHNDLVKYYQISDIFVNMSEYETQSMVMAEALSCGIPVIGVNKSAMPEIINEKVGILIEPKNINQLVSSIIKLYNDINIRDKMSIEAIKYAQKFSINNIVQIWENTYDKLTKK